MIDVFEVLSKSKVAYDHRLIPESPEVDIIKAKIEANDLDFSTNIYRKYDARLVTQFEDLSAENVILLHLKYELKKAFKVNFANRNKIIEELFDRFQVARSLKDCTIVKFDFKQFFYTISTEYVNEKYISSSSLSRQDKSYINELCKSNQYCVAGLPVFNYFIEIISRDLDSAIKTQFADRGLVYYTRYVDDGIIILNEFLSKKDVREILNEAINSVFKNATTKNKVRLNEKKFEVVNSRHLKADRSFDFLGYQFSIKSGFTSLQIGLSASKIDKYQSKVNKLIKNNYIPGDKKSEELVRHIIKAHSSRIIYCSSSEKNSGTWISKGIIANYNKLKDYPGYIDRKTKSFLKEIYRNAFRASGLPIPHYLKDTRYSLYDNMIRNRAMIFNELIGMPKKQLIKELEKIGDTSKSESDLYDRILSWYLICIKVGY